MRKIITATAIAGGIAFGLASPAMASEVPCGTPAVDAVYKTVTTPGKPAVEEKSHLELVKEGYTEEVFSHWQRYSWTGGPIEEGVTPVWTGPDDENWQANVKGDPHRIGKPGAYDRSNEHSGKADWFYLEAVTQKIVHEPVYKKVIDVAAQPAVPATSKEVLVTPEVPAGPECPVVPEEPVVPQKPVVNPEKPVTVVDKPQVVTQKRVSTFADETPAPVSQPELAMTGSDNGPLALLGAGMLGLGVILTALRKRFN